MFHFWRFIRRWRCGRWGLFFGSVKGLKRLTFLLKRGVVGLKASEIESLLADIYDGVPPKFEVDQFIFEINCDSKVS